MNPNIIQFSCTHCLTVLTVPSHLAGVAGPCPKCGQHIVSPRFSEPSLAPEPMASAAPPVPPAYQEAPPNPYLQPPPQAGMSPPPAMTRPAIAPAPGPDPLPPTPSRPLIQPLPGSIPPMPPGQTSAPGYGPASRPMMAGGMPGYGVPSAPPAMMPPMAAPPTMGGMPGYSAPPSRPMMPGGAPAYGPPPTPPAMPPMAPPPSRPMMPGGVPGYGPQAAPQAMPSMASPASRPMIPGGVPGFGPPSAAPAAEPGQGGVNRPLSEVLWAAKGPAPMPGMAEPPPASRPPSVSMQSSAAWSAMPPPAPPAPPAPASIPMPQAPPAMGGMSGMPSIALQPSLLRPGSGLPASQGPAARPPSMPLSAAAQAMMQMPSGTDHGGQGMPSMDDPNAGNFSRPVGVGGSRLSLLARQLTTAPDGTAHLPPAPPELAPGELPGANLNPVHSMPGADRHKAAGKAMFDKSVPRGLHSGHGGRSTSSKVLVIAILLLAVLGAIGWQMKDSLLAHFGGKSGSDLPSDFPSTVAEGPKPKKRPGIDPAPKAKQSPTPAPQEDGTPEIRPAPTPMSPNGSGMAVTPPDNAPPSGPSLPPPTPPPGTKLDPRTAKVDPAAPGSTPKPTTGPVPPRAERVQDDGQTPNSAPPPVPEPPKPKEQFNGIQRQRTVQGMVQEQAGLVEVPGSSQTLEATSKPPADSAVPADGPVAVEVPPACQTALEGLKRFLAARTLDERLPYIQMPDKMVAKAKLYYQGNNDGPVAVDEIHYLRHDETPEVGRGMHVVFILFSRQWEYGFPVMVEQSGNDVRVDWLAFVEFKDDLLHKFLTTYMDGPARFHLGIRRTHYFDDNVPGLDQKDAFEVTTPMENVRGFVFTPKSSPLARNLASTLTWDKEESWVVAELQWRQEGTRRWVELTALPQLNWYGDTGDNGDASGAPPPPAATPAAGTSSTVAAPPPSSGGSKGGKAGNDATKGPKPTSKKTLPPGR